MDNKNEEILTNKEIDELSVYLRNGETDIKEQRESVEDIKLSKNDIVSNEGGSLNYSRDSNSTASNYFNLSDYASWRTVIEKNFPNLLLAAEVGASQYGQLLIKDIPNPCAIALIDVPSAGKTITLNLFSKFDKSLTLDNFTPASFVSQAANVKTEKLKDVDLLPKVRNKVLIIRDLAPLFGLRDDDLLKSMGILTRVLDGEGLELHAGVHGSRGYSGDYSFMFLAASTPIAPKVFKLMGNLGSRLFFLHLRSERKSEETLASQLVITSWKQKQQISQEATNSFLGNLWASYPNGIEWDKTKDPKDCLLIISRCANLLSKLRGSINVWKEDYGNHEEYSYQEPVIEMPDRISQILYNLTRGHALISGRTNIDYDDLGIVINITFDSAALSRSRLFRLLIKNGGQITSDEVVSKINCSKPTALKEIEILKVLGLVDVKDSEFSIPGRPVKIAILKEELSWFISEECQFILKAIEEYYGGVLRQEEQGK